MRTRRCTPLSVFSHALGLQPAIGIGAADLDGGGFDPGLLAGAFLGERHLVAARLGPALVHPQQHLGPVLRLGAAGPGIHLHIGVIGIGLAREQALYLAALGLGGQGVQVGDGGIGSGGIALRLGQLDQFHGIGHGLFELADALDLVGQAVPLAHHLAGGLGIRPQGRVLRPGVQLIEFPDGGIPVKDASSAGPPNR
jgi:hypothetical protein